MPATSTVSSLMRGGCASICGATSRSQRARTSPRESQYQRLARRATVGLSRVGGIGANGSGDIFIAFSTANHIGQNDKISNVKMLAPDAMTSLFQASAEATEEAILNAMCMAETMTGRDSRTVRALPLDLLQDVMQRYRPKKGV